MKKIGIFLDDERVVRDVPWVEYDEGVEWEVVRDSDTFFHMLQTLDPDVVSFDHDIQEFCGEDEVTGYDILKEMVDIYIDVAPLPKCYFHTQNPIGKKNMECYYQNALAHQAKYQGE